MKKILILGIFTLLFSQACKEHSHADKHEHEAPAAAELKLDAGKKWQADAITRTTFAQMEKDLAAAKLADAAAAAKFVEAQDKQIAALLKGCTMKGEAHEQLHILIGKTNAALEELRKAKGETITAAQSQLKATVSLYPRYFE